MTTIRILTVIFILGQSSLTCAQSLKGQSFMLSSKINADCTIENRCDCCFSNLFFISDKEFAIIDYCETGGAYTTGTYSRFENKVTLTFKQCVVSEDSDYLSEKREIKKQNVKIDPIEFEFTKCGQKTETIENLKTKNYRYGVKQSDKNDFKELKGSAAWKLLQN